jgi:hypothetical protein
MSEHTSNHPENGNKEKAVLSFQVPQEYLDFLLTFKDKFGYQTTSNAAKVHLRVAAHIYEKSPTDFFDIIASSKDVLQTV